MGLFSSSLNKNRVEILCDIGNGSVGVALVSYSLSGEKPAILFSERIFSAVKQDKNIQDTIASFNKDLKILLTHVLEHCVPLGITPSRVSCFYSSPWYISETNVLKIKQSEPVVFSDALVKKMLEEGEKNFLANEATNSGLSVDEDIELIERRITRIKLNGYQTHNPIGKKAVDIEVALFLSAVPRSVLNAFKETIDRFWHKVKIEHHSFPLASFSMLRNEFNPQGSYLIVHVAENITDISLVSDDILLDTFSFPLGRRNLIKSIEEKCGLDYEIASSALSMYSKGEIHTDFTKKIGDSIDSAKADWMTHFENACSVLTKKKVTPNFVYLVTGSRIYPFFESIIKDSGSSGYALSAKDLSVYPVEKNIFRKYLLYSSPSNHKDFYLESEVLYNDLVSTKNNKIIDNYIVE